MANNWIPCKERLPKDMDGGVALVKLYLVTVAEKWETDHEWHYEVDTATNFGSYIDDFWDTCNDWKEGQEVHIIAWMPLPEPYQEGNT